MLITTSPPRSVMSTQTAARPSALTAPLTIAIHGGAGTITSDMPPPLQTAYRKRLRASLCAGWAVLAAGGTSLDAACASVKVLEDSPLFNAGRGAVFTKNGKVECEASVMVTAPLRAGDTASGLPPVMHGNAWFERGCPVEEAPTAPAKGDKAMAAARDPQLAGEQGFETGNIPSTRRGAAATLVSHTKNPILLARSLYLLPSEAPHVLLSGLEAEQIGWNHGTVKVSSEYYWTRKRWLEHRRGLGLPDDGDGDGYGNGDGESDVDGDGDGLVRQPAPDGVDAPPAYTTEGSHPDQAVFDRYLGDQDGLGGSPILDQLPQGTVGACAIDASGRLAVATSTGGKTNKSDGRIGDTPSIGAGFWAERFADVGGKELGAAVEEEPFCLCKVTLFAGGDMDSSNARHVGGSKAETDITDKAAGVAVSGTGDGDYFLRASFASLIAHRMRFLGEPAEVAGQKAVDELGAIDGVGGAIVLDAEGRASFPMNSNTMNRGVMTNTAGKVRPQVALFQHEKLA